MCSSTPGLEEGEIASSPPPPQLSQKICFFWYHHGTCHRNPANPTRTGKPCPYQHSLDASRDAVLSISKKVSWLHKAACGLPLCPWKDQERKIEKQQQQQMNNVLAACAAGANATMPFENGPAKRKRHPEMDADASPKRSKPEQPEQVIVSQPQHTPAQKKKKQKQAHQRTHTAARHRDDPATAPQSTMAISYDDDDAAQASPPFPTNIDDDQPAQRAKENEEQETCFFWYHGKCARANDIRTNYTCTHTHALTSPPTMVQPPPGYTHFRPCGLEWCPGDARETRSSEGQRRGKAGKNHGEEMRSMLTSRKAALRNKGQLLIRGPIVEDKEVAGDDDGNRERAGSEAPSCGQPEPPPADVDLSIGGVVLARLSGSLKWSVEVAQVATLPTSAQGSL
ncbi:hypothetical protein LTR36_010742 [Oleoguttula mirabilis]|uniref:C3H1-type domain-containing protein n=1 Tax=Oleoguttula mirabilis TaxID=1507867 RepID=A0AAV9JRK8_9PEZI|nr:hypothetical protein LTR36_010742 [Oleoguttula mirabilis]